MGYPPRSSILTYPHLVTGRLHLYYQKLRTLLFWSATKILQTFQLFLFHQTSNFIVPFSSICIISTKSKRLKTLWNSIIDSFAKIKGTLFAHLGSFSLVSNVSLAKPKSNLEKNSSEKWTSRPLNQSAIKTASQMVPLF